MILNLPNVKDIKKYQGFYVKKITEIHYESEGENPPRQSGDGKIKDLQQTLNSTNDFLMLQVIPYVGSKFKLLSMYWYRSIKLF